MRYKIIQGDCVESMQRVCGDNSVDAIVCDPPYGLEFMGKEFDKLGKGAKQQEWHKRWLKEAFRVLKPGGHLLAFGGSRTYHHLACAVEESGFEVRDMISWNYGSGFPKSLNISKSLDKLAGAEREVVGRGKYADRGRVDKPGIYGATTDSRGERITAPTTDAAKQWDGWGTALKPSHEPCVLARKPLSEKTVAKNVLKHGTGGINVDGCRIETEILSSERRTSVPAPGIWGKGKKHPQQAGEQRHNPSGRFPANVIHDGSEAVVSRFPQTKSGVFTKRKTKGIWDNCATHQAFAGLSGDSGSASRFFYQAKSSKKERNFGLSNEAKNTHPTVKPIQLMRYLIRLVTPPGGVVLDPFLGSGTTVMAAMLEGFDCIGCEQDEDYYEIAKSRCDYTFEHLEELSKIVDKPKKKQKKKQKKKEDN